MPKIFFARLPYDFTTEQCEHYWNDRPSEEKISQLAYQLWQQSNHQHGNALAHWLQAQE